MRLCDSCSPSDDARHSGVRSSAGSTCRSYTPWPYSCIVANSDVELSSA